MKILEEEKTIDQKTKDLATDWNNSKPVQGNAQGP